LIILWDDCEEFSRFLQDTYHNPVNNTVVKTTTTGNTGETAKNRFYTVHHFEGEIEAGKEYFIVDDVSTTGATAYYAARHIASQGGRIAGIIQMGLTARGKAPAKFKPKAFLGDESTLQMSEKTIKTLLKKADEATLNAVLQYHGIAYHWQTLTDALGRALATDWTNASNLAGMPGSGGSGGKQPNSTSVSSSNAATRQSLPAFPGEKAAAGLEPSSKPTPATRIESNGQMGFSFSLSRDTNTSLEALIEARMNRGPEERVRMLETMRTRLQAIVAKLEDRRDGLLSPMEKQLLGWRGNDDLTPEQRERLRIEDAMAAVKGVINALPVEIRSKVAIPITRILDADSDLKTTNAFRELIQNADNVIEEFLQESYTERIANILDTARPTSTESRQNKTLLTPETQRQIDSIDEIVQMEELQVIAAEAAAEAQIIALQEQIDAIDQADPDHDTKARALTRQQIEFVQRLDQIHTFGSLGKASSPELSNAYEKLHRLYTTGRYARKSIDQASREQLRASRQDIKEAVGRPDGVTGPEHSRATTKTWFGGLKESAKAYALEHLNFHEVLETLFPNSITAQQWSKKAIAAMRGTKRRRLAASDRFNAFMADRFGATT